MMQEQEEKKEIPGSDSEKKEIMQEYNQYLLSFCKGNIKKPLFFLPRNTKVCLDLVWEIFVKSDPWKPNFYNEFAKTASEEVFHIQKILMNNTCIPGKQLTQILAVLENERTDNHCDVWVCDSINERFGLKNAHGDPTASNALLSLIKHVAYDRLQEQLSFQKKPIVKGHRRPQPQATLKAEDDIRESQCAEQDIQPVQPQRIIQRKFGFSG